MEGLAGIIVAIDLIAREATLFAAVGFLIGGIDDLAVDVIFALRWLRAAVGGTPKPAMLLANRCNDATPGRLAIFIPAWDEQVVIGAMLRHALATLHHPDYRLYVGAYPNDLGTIMAVAAVAETDPRVRLVINSRDGPTTKADCLNTLWRALERDRAAEGKPVHAVVLHDAEDVVHRDELTLFDALVGQYTAVQLPVLPLPHAQSRLVGGHYGDEFAEAHGKQLVVREALGAALPLAGVGCAIDHAMLARIADRRDGNPFDADSLTEDYELGLRIGAMGGRGAFALATVTRDAGPVVIRAYFPATLDTAVRQKARWMTGIALAGWDRIGWARWHRLGDHWMRMRDRRAPLAVLVLAAAYLALVANGVSLAGHALARAPGVPGATPQWLLTANGLLLLWRLLVRGLFAGRIYGWREGMLAMPRMVVSNIVAMLAARRALGHYLRLLRGQPPRWDKTAHLFPDIAPASTAR